jgi:hypothetical protein
MKMSMVQLLNKWGILLGQGPCLPMQSDGLSIQGSEPNIANATDAVQQKLSRVNVDGKHSMK